ncbi:MAG: biotin/lipoyl-binding protein, partial [Proteobacteria bacterium]|nr:biotin/lipoyl-binding protein [Pseudomonadota bacterium]
MKKAQKVALGLVTGLALLAGFISLRDYGQETTDDAQVEARIVNISARMSGQVQKVFITDNQVVKVGDPLVELDRTEWESKLAAAQADLIAARANLSSSESDVAAANSRLRLSEIELNRIRKLTKD